MTRAKFNFEGADNVRRSGSRCDYSYDIDETGVILGTRERFSGSGEVSGTLAPLKKPNKPLFIDTPEKKAKWDAYWDEQVGRWEAERMNERRKKW